MGQVDGEGPESDSGPTMDRYPRRQFLQGSLALAGFGLLSGCGRLPSQQQPARARRIGYLDPLSQSANTETCRQGLRELGYVEEQNIVVEYRFAEGNSERLPTLAAELVGLQLELIVAANTVAALAIRQVTSTISIVMLAGNVVAAGLVTNIARPEGNITGLTTNSVELVGKWVELLKEAAPSMARLAALADPSSPVLDPHLREAERAARAFQLEFSLHELRNLDQLPAVLSTIKAAGGDGLLVLPGGVIRAGADPRLGNQALSSQLPAVSEVRDFAVNGGLLAYGASSADLARRVTTYVDKILKGAKPGNLPVEQPTKIEFVVNVKTAKALGVALPQALLLQADKVIE